MKPKQRQAAILEYLQRHGKTAVDALAEHFSTTGTTIRKDLTLLEEEGEVIRTYGGVVLSRDDGDQPIDRKTHINTEKNATSPAPGADRRRRLADLRCRQHGAADGAAPGAVQ